MSEIIYFSGAHSTGKTTSVFKKALELKETTNKSVGIIMEVPRYCPYPVYTSKHKPIPESQEWIFATQLSREAEETGKYDIVISDRTIVDCIAYSKLFNFNIIADLHYNFAKYYPWLYCGEIIVKQINPEIMIQNDNFRATDLLIRERYQDILLNLYDDLGIDVTLTK